MKNLIVLLLLLIVSSCSDDEVTLTRTEYQTLKGSTVTYPIVFPDTIKTFSSVLSIPFTVILIDGCEYIYRGAGSSTVMAHKGNCRFCEQRWKQYLQQLP
jgi:hypothetical protein